MNAFIEESMNTDNPGEEPHGFPRRALARFWRACRDNKKVLLLFLALFVLYNITLKINFSYDCTPNMYLPISMLKHGSVTLDFFPKIFTAEVHYYAYPYNGSYYSPYGIGAPLFAIPFYLPFTIFQEMPSRMTILYLSKAIAAFYVALSAALLYAAMRRITRDRWALIATLIYALLTPVFCTASQMYWQHSPALFLSSLAVYFLVRGEEQPRFTALAGLPLGLAVLVRTNTLVAILPVLVYIVWRKRSQIVPFLLFLSPGLALTGLYNYMSSGSPFTFPIMARTKYFPQEYSYLVHEAEGSWNTPFFTGFFGNLISPSRGIFTTSPVLLGSACGFLSLFSKAGRERNRYRGLYFTFAAVFLLHLLMISKWTAWTGGESFGNRLLIDALPFLCILFIPALEFFENIRDKITRQALKGVFIVLIIVSALIQIEGIVSYDGGSWGIVTEVKQEAAWSVVDSEFVFYARNPDPSVPPLIRKITGEPPRMSGLRFEAAGEIPQFIFELSEIARIEWYIIDPENGNQALVIDTVFPKGENVLAITDEDLAVVAERIAFTGDLRQLSEAIRYSFSYEFVVKDLLVPVRKSYFVQ
ncbi:MAG: phospholipid carrier-dependent glycosyltransferase [Actinobacteria bacterium]|jgi:hypothetical protein|nr:MAG: phospholipid carrier-dependent glycosyltransferase [Actinomycetota bacterium]